MELLQTVLSFILALGILVTLHEYGHFWVARRCGVKVLRFSVGFGAPLFKWTDKQGTEFWIASIPLGGYVKMLDAREGDVPEALKDQEFTQKPVLQRIAVFAAGPLVNLLFAVLVYWVLFLYGITVLTPTLGDVDPQSPAGQAGLHRGAEIVAVDGQKVTDWEAVTYALVERIGDSGTIEITATPEGSNVPRTYRVSVERFLGAKEIDSPLQSLGLTVFRPAMPPVIDEVVPGYAAERDGLKPNDLIVAVDGEPIKRWIDWVNVVQANPEKTLDVTLEREGVQIVLPVTPNSVEVEEGKRVGRIGARTQPVDYPPEMHRVVRYGVFEAMGEAIDKTHQLIVIIFKTIGKMIVGVVSVDNLSGPITIAQIAGDTASYGVEPFLSFLAYLSISLGVLNLLPIPVLDGGHILFACFEMVRGKPLSERIQQAGVSLGLTMLAMFMLVAFYNDIVRLAQ